MPTARRLLRSCRQQLSSTVFGDVSWKGETFSLIWHLRLTRISALSESRIRMGLKSDRNVVIAKLDTGAEEAALISLVQKWFESFKAWEKKETFERPFRDGRMTARVSDPDKKADFKVINTDGGQSSVRLNMGAQGVLDRMNALKFIRKEKNTVGLHALSAVLLKPDTDIGKQLFAPYIFKVVIFAPIPLEGDLQLFARLSEIAKANKTGDLYKLIIIIRANMTRISMGAAEDMAVGFSDIGSGKKDDVHIRYGHANIQGKAIDPGVMAVRTQNALKYMSMIAAIKTEGGNNEVLVKYRSHGGGFPYFGNPSEGKFICASASTKELIGTVDQRGNFSTSVPRK